STLGYRSGRFLRRHRESLAAALVVLGLVAALATWQMHRVSRQNAAASESTVSQNRNAQVQGRRSVAILGFKNLSDRQDTAWVSTALSETLTAEMAAGEQLRIVPDETVARTKIDLGLSDIESLPRDTLAKVRKNLASDFIILGSYLDLGKDKGGQVRLDLRLEETARGETVAALSETGTEKTIIELASQVGARLRERFGLEKLSPIESDGVRAELPSNPEAMRPYSQGLAKIRAFDALSARDLLSSAVAADPSFPLAHSELARTWLSLGYDSNAQQGLGKGHCSLPDPIQFFPGQSRVRLAVGQRGNCRRPGQRCIAQPGRSRCSRRTDEGQPPDRFGPFRRRWIARRPQAHTRRSGARGAKSK